jgi:hypothetical protein
VTRALYPSLTKVGYVGAGYDAACGLLKLRPTPPAPVRAAEGIKETLESLRYVQYLTLGVARVGTIQDTKRGGVLHM